MRGVGSGSVVLSLFLASCFFLLKEVYDGFDVVGAVVEEPDGCCKNEDDDYVNCV